MWPSINMTHFILSPTLTAHTHSLTLSNQSTFTIPYFPVLDIQKFDSVMASFESSEIVFELSGGREMVTAARATELLEAAGAQVPSNGVSVIRLSNKSFGQEAAEIMATKLRYVVLVQ